MSSQSGVTVYISTVTFLVYLVASILVVVFDMGYTVSWAAVLSSHSDLLKCWSKVKHLFQVFFLQGSYTICANMMWF